MNQPETVIIAGGAKGIGEAKVVAFIATGARVAIADADLAAATFGPPTVLVNNAGIFSAGPLLETTPQDWKRVIDVNLIGTYLGIRAVAPRMIHAGRGAIVNTSSSAGAVGVMNLFAYSSSKWAIRGLTRTAALELGHHGIRVNAVIPGITQTPAMRQAGFPKVLPQQAIARAAEASEVAEVVIWLSSPAASFVTCSEYVVDGGAAAGVVTSGFCG